MYYDREGSLGRVYLQCWGLVTFAVEVVVIVFGKRKLAASFCYYYCTLSDYDSAGSWQLVRLAQWFSHVTVLPEVYIHFMITESVIVDPSRNSYASTILAKILRKLAWCDVWCHQGDTCEKKPRTTKNTISEQNGCCYWRLAWLPVYIQLMIWVTTLPYARQILLPATSGVSPLRTSRSIISTPRCDDTIFVSLRLFLDSSVQLL